MALTRWASFDDRLRWPEEIFRAFSPFFTGLTPQRAAGVFPPVNLYDEGEAFIVRAEIPGVDKEALEIAVKGDELTIGGERKRLPPAPNVSYHRRERDGGRFRRVVTLPQPVDPERISASYRNGVLEVVLPRVLEARQRKITVS